MQDKENDLTCDDIKKVIFYSRRYMSTYNYNNKIVIQIHYSTRKSHDSNFAILLTFGNQHKLIRWIKKQYFHTI